MVSPEAVALSIATAQAFNDVDNASLSYSASGLPAWLTIDTGTGVISGTPPIGASVPGSYPITVTASDAEPLSATQSFTITILPFGLFSDGFETARRRGSGAHDEIYPAPDGVFRSTNRAGGLEGGMTNGQPLRFQRWL